jgi:uncharacterized protein (TIGR03083 family)
MDDIRDMIAAQRTELGELLAGLPAARWDEPSLCAGWRVREVVAHITMPFRYSGRRFAVELARSGGRFGAMADRVARRDAASLGPDELAEAVLSNVGHPWKPPGGGFEGALSHDVIHGLDVTVPLGLPHVVPEERLRLVLPGSLSERSVRYFGVDLDGVELRADDMEWSLGSGAAVTGAAADLLLVVCGRPVAPGRLKGEASGRFTRLPAAPPA